jgi:hypothetical protein
VAITHQRGWAAEAYRESPWYFPLAELWQTFASHTSFPTPAELSALYRTETTRLSSLCDAARALSFVAAPAKKRRPRRGLVDLAELYEGRIVLGGEVPTRIDDWHDFFNALTFAAFPRAKWALHGRQFALLRERLPPGARRLPGARSREQDALALFDEGGIALVVSPTHAAELAASDADTLNVVGEALCRAGEARPVPFGHALPEHLVEGLPVPLGTVHVLALDFHGLSNKRLLDAVDEALAEDLGRPELFTVPSPARGLSLSRSGADPRASTRAI